MASYNGHLPIVRYLVDTCHVPPDQPDSSNNTALLYSAMGGHSDLVEFFIDRNCNTSQINALGASLSLLACQSGQLALVNKLEELSLFSQESKCNIGRGVLHYTCRSASNSLDLFKYLLTRYKLEINIKDQYGRTPLHIASWYASSSVVEHIVSIQGNEALLVTDNDGWSCLHRASYASMYIEAGIVYSKLSAPRDSPNIGVINNTRTKQNIDFMKRNERVRMFSSLLKKANTCPSFTINTTTTNGWSLLYLAFRTGSTLLVKALEEYNINTSVDNDGRSPVNEAARSGSTSVLNCIISNNLEPDYSGQTPLVYSCQSGSINSVQYLINNNSNPNITDECGKTCLHHSCQNGHIDITQYLIEVQHCDINKTDIEGRTLLHLAALSGNFDVVQYLITEQGLSPTAVDKNGRTALHYASWGLNLPLVTELITTYGLDPHQADSNGKLPLHYAAESGNILLLELYVKTYMCSVSQTDNDGWNVVHYSSLECYPHFITHIIRHYPELSAVCKYHDGNTPLHFFCKMGQQKMVSLLSSAYLSANISILITNKKGQTPLHLAANKDSAKALISSVTDSSIHHDLLTARDNEGCTVFHTACSVGHYDMFLYLCSVHPEGVSVVDNKQRTLLHAACKGSNLNLVKCLVEECELHPETRDKDGITCMHILAEKGNIEIYQYMKDVVSFNYMYYIPRDNIGRTPLHYACISSRFKMSRYLIDQWYLNPENSDYNGYNSVHAACEAGNMELVLYFLTELHCNPYTETNDFKTVIYYASKSSDLELVRFLVNAYGLKPRPHDIEVAQSVNPESSVVKYLHQIYDKMTFDEWEDKRKKTCEGYYEKQQTDPLTNPQSHKIT